MVLSVYHLRVPPKSPIFPFLYNHHWIDYYLLILFIFQELFKLIYLTTHYPTYFITFIPFHQEFQY